MKKQICLFLLLILLSISLFSCSNNANSNDSPVSPAYPSFRFYSTTEFLDFFKPDDNTGEIPAVSKNQSKGDYRNVISEDYTDFVDKMILDPYLYLPTKKEEAFFLTQDGYGYPCITIFSVESYQRPWIVCHMLDADGRNFSFCYMYLSNEEIAFAENHTYSDLKKMLNPQYPSLHNWKSHRDIYKQVYEVNLNLQDRTVSALIYEQKDYDRIRVEFIYDDIMVELWMEPLDLDWFKTLSFSKVTSENPVE